VEFPYNPGVALLGTCPREVKIDVPAEMPMLSIAL
jgi:hypothetical protein